MEFPVLQDQRFFTFRLNELFDVDSQVIKDYVSNHPNAKDLADSIIRDVKYPFHMGSPDDTHLYNCYHGKYRWCKRIDWDYWQKSQETLTIFVGDCEDSSIAFVTCCLHLKVPAYEIFGVVRDAATNEILGGHGWSAFQLEEEFRIYESTLDVPPQEYPIYGDGSFESLLKPLTFESIIYDPEWVFNKDDFRIVLKGLLFKTIGFIGEVDYTSKIKKKYKDTIEKHRAIEKAWKQPTKVTKEYDKLSNKLKRLFSRR